MHIVLGFIGILCFVLCLLALPHLSGKQIRQGIFAVIGVMILLGILAGLGVPFIGLLIVFFIIKGVMSNSSKNELEAKLIKRAEWTERMDRKKEGQSSLNNVDDNGPGI